MGQAKFLPLPQTTIDPAYELVAHLARHPARDVRVHLSRPLADAGPTYIEGTPYRINPLEYRRGDVTVASPYYYAGVTVPYRKPNGDIGELPGCPYIYAVDVDWLTAQYHKECQRCFGATASRAELDQFFKDIVDAMRLYADEYFRLAITDDGKKPEAKVLGFELDAESRKSWKAITELVAKGLAEAERRWPYGSPS
jgi:hypothetical protein